MTQYIDKAALVAETKRRIKTNKECMLGLRNLDYYQGKVDALNDTISFLDTLEVKKVDLEKELDEWIKYGPHTNYPWCTIPDAIKITAEHFFELGLKAQKGEEI